ncbi:uncharacterized protein LOC134535664 [Bacillus rossius redtenbacheri]|uniref:uncharacterized protein LOC134535664 n=1 Tax=Bacillus rossius redtenbacheri TaxID=93214 RepID=UPI002FDCA369
MLKRLALLLVLALGVVCLVLPESQSPRSSSGRQTEAEAGAGRLRRQAVPASRRLGVLQALWQLLFGTARDTARAFANITDLIQTNLIPTLQLGDAPPTSTSTTEAPLPGASTTEPPYRLTRQEALDIIRRNLYGLVRLFRREFRLAINDSRLNAARTDEDLRSALRPYFT